MNERSQDGREPTRIIGDPEQAAVRDSLVRTAGLTINQLGNELARHRLKGNTLWLSYFMRQSYGFQRTSVHTWLRITRHFLDPRAETFEVIFDEDRGATHFLHRDIDGKEVRSGISPYLATLSLTPIDTLRPSVQRLEEVAREIKEDPIYNLRRWLEKSPSSF